MFRKIDWKSTLTAAAIAAVLFCIPAFFYIQKAVFAQSWLLFLGSVLFFFAMAMHTVAENKKRGGNESTVALVFEAHVTTICGIIIACIICFILLMIMVPGFLSFGSTSHALTGEPPNAIGETIDKSHGLSFYL